MLWLARHLSFILLGNLPYERCSCGQEQGARGETTRREGPRMSVLRPRFGAASATDLVDRSGELCDDGFWLGSQCACDEDELYGAELALPFLVFGDKGLRLVQASGHLGLRQPGFFAEATKQGAKLFLGRRTQGVAHCGRPGSVTTAFPNNPSSGLSHFRIPFGRFDDSRASLVAGAGEGAR